MAGGLGDKIKGATKEVAGKVEAAVGEAGHAVAIRPVRLVA